MPTPVAHTLCGYVFYESTTRWGNRRQWRKLFALILAANLADVDYFPGFVLNQPNLFHHGPSHSLFFTIAFGLIGGSIGRLFKLNFWYTFLSMGLAYGSHLLLDFVTVDTVAPFGEQLFWPFSSAYYLSPILLFRDIDKGGTNVTFFANAFGTYNLKTIFLELAIFSPIIIGIRLIKKYSYINNRINY